MLALTPDNTKSELELEVNPINNDIVVEKIVKPEKIVALALFSGGLDSALAVKTIMNQGVEVIALHFVSHFFGSDKNLRVENIAKSLGCQLEYVDFSQKHTEIVKNPANNYGKQMNPCLDCHALMFEIAGELLEKFNAKFIISGEVAGQRPKSQNYEALDQIRTMCRKIENLIVRPLSALLLKPTLPEEKGWIDRNKLHGIYGRGRQPQMKLLKEYGMDTNFENWGVAGGCLLTDPEYSLRLKVLQRDGFLDNNFSFFFHLVKNARFFRFGRGKYVFVGRKYEENERIFKYKGHEKSIVYVEGTRNTPGPDVIAFDYTKLNEKREGETKEPIIPPPIESPKDIFKFVKQVFSYYSKFKGEKEAEIQVHYSELMKREKIAAGEKLEEDGSIIEKFPPLSDNDREIIQNYLNYFMVSKYFFCGDKCKQKDVDFLKMF